jgi:hypothetical protein
LAISNLTAASAPQISQLLVATLQLPELLEFLIENVPVTPGAGPLIFTSADRLDLLTGLMYARESGTRCGLCRCRTKAIHLES